jgi:hypothetical protein
MKTKIVLVAIVAVIAAMLVWVKPIAQDLNYHLFADALSQWGVANFWNVMSNLPFVVIGLMGLWSLSKQQLQIKPQFSQFYWVFFTGIVGVGMGSSWYHLNPNNDTLVWDRLPMTVAFMAFFAAILAEHVDLKLGQRLLWPLIGLGLLSIIYWQYSESIGQGDLRWYALVQFLPLIMIPVIFMLYPKPYNLSYLLWLFLACYVVAKLLEYYDLQIFQSLIWISGHSLKHVAAAVGVFCYWVYLRRRVALSS